jgi:hypothetical protein
VAVLDSAVLVRLSVDEAGIVRRPELNFAVLESIEELSKGT